MYRILIVSGDIVLRKTIAFSLHDLNVRVECVDTVEAMLDLCRRSKFDLVILLGQAAPVCRHEMMEALRPEKNHVPRFYVLSWQQSEQVVQCMYDSGVDQYMTLPVNPHRLRSKIERELSRCR